MRVNISEFAGTAPRRDPKLLPPNVAIVAENAHLARGSLRPLEQPLLVYNTPKTGVQSIYRHGQAAISNTEFWWHWSSPVNVVKGFVFNDTDERTFYTGDGQPKFGTVLSNVGADLPSVGFPLGIGAPTAAPVLAANGGTPGVGELQEARVYRYAFVNSYGDISALSPTETVSAYPSLGVTLSGLQTVAPGGVPFSAKRIFRAAAGLLQFVAEISAAATTYNDLVSNNDLGEAAENDGWLPPPTDLAGLTGGHAGVMAGFRGYDVYFCEPFAPYAWPLKYVQTQQFPVVALGHFDQTWIVLTSGTPAALSGNSPDSYSQEPLEFKQPCVSARSVVSDAGGVFFASPDGLCFIGPGVMRVLTEDIMTPEDWRALVFPSTLIGAYHEGRYIGSYFDGVQRRGFTYDPVTQEWVNLPDLQATAFYRDTTTDALFVAIGDDIYKYRGGAAGTFRWRSKEYATTATSFAAARVEGTHPCNFKLYGEGVLIHERTVTNNEAFRLPSGRYRRWSVEVAGSQPIQLVSLASSMYELKESP